MTAQDFLMLASTTLLGMLVVTVVSVLVLDWRDRRRGGK